ncbi:hypothetical protein [Fibrobacter sp. UWB12]|uniref:hypothetical protein n=1 Tax=Fibrobacter sp. UWB12 TaxID=1896203 RepID=UPI00091068CB|nr:hypothetical protein [Fibrobacter sp. UWB12]SHK35775.1 hypothetical protein SAMN05720759_102103 [Fibrobacter sp. UWB12]
MKHLYKILSFPVTIFVSLITVAFSLVTIASLAACGNENSAGTDEQPNAITAQIDAAVDSASAIWFQGEKTFIVDSKASFNPLTPTPIHDIIINLDTSAQHTSLLTGVKTEHGTLRHLEIAYVAAISCETEETWFAYSVQVSSSLIQKNFTIPDTSATSIAMDFEADCIHEHGNFITETEGITDGQQSYSCKIAPTKENLVENNAIQYTDPNWKKYGTQIIKVCRE